MDRPMQKVQKPVISWRQKVIQAGAIVASPWRRYRAAIFQGYLILAVVLFTILAVLAHTIAYFTFDLNIELLVQSFRPGWFDALMRFVSWFGFPPQVDLVMLGVILFLYLTGLRWEAVALLVSAAGITIIGFVIKALVVRPRPSSDLIHVFAQVSGYSFPSGHVLFYTAFFGFLLFLSYALLKPSVLRIVLLTIFFSMVALVGLSRVYEGEHWPSDVLGGYLLSTVWLTFVVRMYQWGKTRFFVHQPIAKPVGDDKAT